MTEPAAENAALARRYLYDVVAAGDPDAAELFLAPDAEVHGPDLGTVADGWPAGADGPVSVDVRDVVSAGDRVAVRAVVSGDHRAAPGRFRPPTGRFEVAQGWFCRVEDGRIAELWALPDGLGLLSQLGALPTRPERRHGHDTESDPDS